MTANWDETWERIQNGTKLLEDQRVSLASTFLTQLQVILDLTPAMESPNQAAFEAGMQAIRAGFANPVSAPAWQAVWAAPLVQLAQIFSVALTNVQTPSTDLGTIIGQLIRYMAEEDYRIPSRDILRGSWVAAPAHTPSPNGEVVRLTVDRYGNPLESGFADVVSFVCQLDAQSGTTFGQEVFSVQGRRYLDILTALNTTFGSGATDSMTGITGDQTQALVLNPSFADASGTNYTSSFQLTNWSQSFIAGSASGLALDTVNYYRPCAIEATPASLIVSAGTTVVLTQTLASRRGALARGTAYFCQLALDNFTSPGSTGQVIVSIGSQSWSYTFTGLETDWTLLRPTIDKNLYFENFDESDLEVSITIACTAGEVRADDFLWAPFVNFDGCLYAVVGGDVTFLVDDAGSFTDTEPRQTNPTTAPGKIQWGLAVAFGQSLPSVVPPPTTAPTVALAGAGAGNVNNGAHTYAVTFVGQNGTESPAGPTAAVTVVDKTVDGQVAVTNIPLGPAGTVSRKVYRSVAATTTPLKLLTTIANNVSTSYNDNIADGSLGVANPPALTMIADPA